MGGRVRGVRSREDMEFKEELWTNSPFFAVLPRGYPRSFNSRFSRSLRFLQSKENIFSLISLSIIIESQNDN